jgi:hypothetical protein
MMKKMSLILVFFSCVYILWAQNQSPTISKSYPKLVLDVPVLDLSYHNYAAKTVSRQNCYPHCEAQFGDYFRAYANPSMRQSLQVTTNVISAAHYGIRNLIKTKNRKANEVLTGFSLLLTDFIMLYAPLGQGWMHEEYHRAVLTKHYVNSYDEYNNFPLGKTFVLIKNVSDEDLIRFKKESNTDFVRAASAGIEGEYLLIHNLQKNNFYYRQQLPNYLLYIIQPINNVHYIAMSCSDDNIEMAQEVYDNEGANIKKRDFIGYDFSAWVYDLFHPDEPYENRGIHPSGVGIDRYITNDDLTEEERDYLGKQAKLHFLNLISPMVIGFNSIVVKKDSIGNDVRINFALRHLLTSFGSDISTNIFYQTSLYNLFFAYHHYQNYRSHFPGVELEIIDYPLKIKTKTYSLTARIMLWTQPENQLFKTSNMKLGGLFGIKAHYPLNRIWQPYFELEGKTPGWVAGNVFLESNLSMRLGVRAMIF